MINKHYLFLLLGLTFSLRICSQTFMSDGIKYEILSASEQTCKVAQLNRGLSGDVVLPGIVTDPSTQIQYTLTDIGSFAFLESYYITSVTIPSTVTSVHLSAFSSCLILPSLHIPASVNNIQRASYIGEELYALEEITVSPDNPYYDSRENCNAIIDSRTNELILGCGTTQIPNSITKIGDFSFYMRKNLEELHIPSSVLTIGQKAFYGCDNLQSVTIPSGVRSLGNNSFTECQSLEEIYISETVSQIGNAFASCPLLRRIHINENNPYYDSRGGCNAIIETSTNKMILASNSTTFIPNTVTAIGDCAFNFYDRITTLVIPESVRGIGIQAFFHCKNLVSITLPEGIKKLNGTFSGCTSLKAVRIPSTVDTLLTDVFKNCESLESIVIPKSVFLIHGDNFEGCFNLKSIEVEDGNEYFDSRENCNAIIRTSSNEIVSGCMNTTFPKTVKSLGYASFRGRNNIVDIVLPDNIEAIGAQAFAFCSNLQSITLPRNLMIMGNAAFMECNSLKTVYSRIEEPFKFGTYVWDTSVIASATLVVPLGCREKYLQLDDWKGFGNIVEQDLLDTGGTGISQMDNAIGAEEVTAFVGSKITLPIVMNNKENIIGMQFDLTLPKGVNVVIDEDDEYMFTLTNRAASSHRVTADEISDGSYRVLVSSLQNSKFKGNEGTIIEATLAIAEDMAAGEYPVEITNVEMTTAQNVALRPDAFVSKLIVQDVVPGDANGDGTVSVTDVTMTISHILGQTPAGFNKDAVDINRDGSISVTDVTMIIDMILKQK